MPGLRRGWLLALVAVLPTLAQGKDLELVSTWAKAEVKIDGLADEWTGLLMPLEDSQIAVGVLNDRNFLYLCFKTSDEKTWAQLKRLGLTVWASGEGKAKKGFGVHYPVGMRPSRTRADGGAAAPSSDDTRVQGSFWTASELELIGPTEEDRLRIAAGSSDSVKAALNDEPGGMVIEMRIPLGPTEAHPLAIGAAPGATISLGLETVRPKARAGEEGSARAGTSGGREPGGTGGMGGRGGMGSRGGMGGMGSGRSGRRGGSGSSEGRSDAPKPIKIWGRVSLAVQPASQAPAAVQPAKDP